MSEMINQAAPTRDSAIAARPRLHVKRYVFLAAIALAGIAASGISERHNSDIALAKWTDERAVPYVDLVSPKYATDSQHLTLPADIQAFNVARIHARVSGYVRGWYKDIGARVKAGELLAKIDSPDLDQSYVQAQGQLAKAQADLSLATVTASRWNTLRTTAIVSQQAADEKTGDALARKADVAAAQANLDRLKALEGFKDIVAPFDGVVTARRVEVGALVSPTSSAAWNEPDLFDVSEVGQIRVYVRVPQVYASDIHKGMSMTVTLPQYPSRSFSGTVETTSNAIAQKSRTLLVEALLSNKDGLLQPGSYAQASFDLPLDHDKLAVPVKSLIFRGRDPEVAVVDNGKVALKKISILADTGTTIEVASGLEATDKIVANPSDIIASGDTVHVASIDDVKVDHRLAATTGAEMPLTDQPTSNDD